MIFAEVEVNGVCAHAVRKRIIPAGIVGAQVSFSFTDPKWDNLTKTVVFKAFGTRDVILEGDTVRIPQEVVSRKDVRLLVGVYGTDAENAIAIPTLWADLGTVRNAADPSGEEAADPTLPIWATLKAEIDKLKENGASDEQISKAVEAYLRKNVDLTGYATQQWVQDGYQPKGEYLESTQLAAAVEEALAQAKKSGEFDGEPGYTPKKGIDYFDGKDGYTPVKGVDYFDGDDYVLTDADKTEIAEQATALVEVPGGGIAVTGATVGQTVKISAVDENGVPTAWESVDFPSGGGEKLVADGTKIATGTIPDGTAAWARGSLGVTIGDLKKWKKFRIMVNLAANSTFGLGVEINGTFTYLCNNTAGVGQKMFYDLEWLDTDRTILGGYFINGNAYNNPSKDTIVSTSEAGGFTGSYTQLPLTFRILDNTYDELELTWVINSAQTAESVWSIFGILRYGEE